MHVILSYFDARQGPRFYMASHPHNAEVIKKNVLGLMDISSREGFFEYKYQHEQDVSLANYQLEIPSEWARGQNEMLMLSVVVDPIQNPQLFKPLMQRYGKILKDEPDLYKSFYMDTEKGDASIIESFHRLEEIFNNFVDECEDILVKTVLGKVLIFGLPLVGKTTLVNTFMTNAFNPNITPTLGVQVSRIMIENYQLHAFDVGGQMKLEKVWQRFHEIPKAIIFVIDVSADDKQHKAACEFFKKIMDKYFLDDNGKWKLSENKIPILILGNKLDLNEDFSIRELKVILNPQKYPIIYHLGLTSALLNKGILDNIRWLISRLILTEDG